MQRVPCGAVQGDRQPELPGHGASSPTHQIAFGYSGTGHAGDIASPAGSQSSRRHLQRPRITPACVSLESDCSSCRRPAQQCHMCFRQECQAERLQHGTCTCLCVYACACTCVHVHMHIALHLAGLRPRRRHKPIAHRLHVDSHHVDRKARQRPPAHQGHGFQPCVHPLRHCALRNALHPVATCPGRACAC